MAAQSNCKNRMTKSNYCSDITEQQTECYTNHSDSSCPLLYFWSRCIWPMLNVGTRSLTFRLCHRFSSITFAYTLFAVMGVSISMWRRTCWRAGVLRLGLAYSRWAWCLGSYVGGWGSSGGCICKVLVKCFEGQRSKGIFSTEDSKAWSEESYLLLSASALALRGIWL